MWNRFLVAAFLVIIFSSCEDSMILKSEKKMKDDIQGTWRRSFQGADKYFGNCGVDSMYYDEYWIFSGDNLHTTYEYASSATCDYGTPDKTNIDAVDTVIVSKFKIDTKLFDAFLKLQLISGDVDTGSTFYDKWEFVTLDDDVLYLATDAKDGAGVVQREFIKIK